MAELLIYGDPQDGSQRYGAGDVVQVLDDGSCPEPPVAPWYVLKIPSVSLEQVNYLTNAVMQPPMRRQYCVNFEKLPIDMQLSVSRCRWAYISQAQLLCIVRDKVSDTYPGILG